MIVWRIKGINLIVMFSNEIGIFIMGCLLIRYWCLFLVRDVYKGESDVYKRNWDVNEED